MAKYVIYFLSTEFDQRFTLVDEVLTGMSYGTEPQYVKFNGITISRKKNPA